MHSAGPLLAVACFAVGMLGCGEGSAQEMATTGSISQIPLPSASVSPSDIYVAINGLDSNPGTREAPFKTIYMASTIAGPGTTVHVAAGIYEGSFKTSSSGNSSARLRYIADVPWSAKIVPPLNSSDRSAWVNEGNYVDIEGFEIDGSNPGNGVAWTTGIYVPGSYNIVRNNHIHHIATDPVLCTNNGGAGVITDHYYFGVNNDVVENVIHHIGSSSCHFIHGTYIGTSGAVANNLVYQIGYAAIQLWHDAASVTIANNTVFGSTYGILIGGGDFYHTNGPADDINVFNNIVVDNVYGISETGLTGTRNTYTNNLLYLNRKLDWRLQNGLVPSNTVAADPRFVSYMRDGGGDYHLASDSPAIDSGSPSYALSIDIEGTPRPQGAAADIGAFEFK